jgi:hypothetical protein
VIEDSEIPATDVELAGDLPGGEVRTGGEERGAVDAPLEEIEAAAILDRSASRREIEIVDGKDQRRSMIGRSISGEMIDRVPDIRTWARKDAPKPGAWQLALPPPGGVQVPAG